MADAVKGRKKIAGDQLQTEKEYAEFTRKWIEAIKPNLAQKNSFYIFNSDWMICALREGMKAAGLYYSQLIIWVKNSMVLGRKDYNPQHELIAYGWHGSHRFERSTAKSVIFCPKPTKAKLHPTMKPVELLRKLIANSTKTGEWVCDPFLGSGSTLIACEHLETAVFGDRAGRRVRKDGSRKMGEIDGIEGRSRGLRGKPWAPNEPRGEIRGWTGGGRPGGKSEESSDLDGTQTAKRGGKTKVHSF